MTQNEAAAAITAWFQGNQERINQESEQLDNELQQESNAAQSYNTRSNLSRSKRKTVRMSKVVDSKTLNKNMGGQVFDKQDKFKAFLKGIIDIQGRMTAPFSVIINFGKREPANDRDFTRYNSYLGLHVDEGRAWFSLKIDGKTIDLTDNTELVMSNIDVGLEDNSIQTYWLSYDRDNMCLKYGKGYAMTETTLLICDLGEGVNTAEKMARKRKQWSKLFAIYDDKRDNDINIFLYRSESDLKKDAKLVKKGEAAGFINMEKLIEVRKEPLTVNPSPYVLDSDKATLNIIDRAIYMFSSELPTSCKVLYDTIKNTELDMEFDMGISDVRLSDAIRYSIETEGGLLNKILKTKPYLRITMGKGLGESPGIPYVLEIWPKNARSPIHNHGAVCAVIKVLFGTIQSGVYNKVTSAILDTKGNFKPTELFKFNAQKDDVTWMSPEWYQTHQLRNVSNDYCATVQCYRYDDKDNIQWNQFDYVKDENGEVGNFFPNTDFTFGQMRDQVLQEWHNRMV